MNYKKKTIKSDTNIYIKFNIQYLVSKLFLSNIY